MSEQQISSKTVKQELTQHAMLVAWGRYAQEIGLISALEDVKIKQKTRTHSPQKKVLEFFVALLAGTAYLKDISLAGHPIDKDKVLAAAWEQESWADYSGVSRTLSQLSETEVNAVIGALDKIEEPFIQAEVTRALAQQGRLVYDGDLTGRPISSTSHSYPNAAFGHMGNEISFGYQSAMVSMHSPGHGRLWLSNTLHPGNTVSMTQVQALVAAAETRTKCQPRRRVDLVAQRIALTEEAWQSASERYEESHQKFKESEASLHDLGQLKQEWAHKLSGLTLTYAQQNRVQTAHCELTRAQSKVQTYHNRWPRSQKKLAMAERRLKRHTEDVDELEAQLIRLRQHHAQLVADSAANLHPICATFRLDAGFASRANIDWLIEMGYDIYVKGREAKVRDSLCQQVTSETIWTTVGSNAELTAWAHSTMDGYFTYPLDVALANYSHGDTSRHSLLLHFGDEDVTSDLAQWFHTYNSRQTIEAGIKEGKNVFEMHHLKVRALPALQLQEHFACFAANFVRLATAWLADQAQTTSLPTRSVKEMVKVAAHTSALVSRQDDIWFLRFSEQSCYAGQTLRLGAGGYFQLPLPILNFQNCHF